MAKQPYELLPHQYADSLLKKIKWILPSEPNEIGLRMVLFNPEWRIMSEVSEKLQGKSSYREKLGMDKGITDEQIDSKFNEVRLEHAKLVYQAKKSGIKVHNRILSCYPELDKWAKEHNWDNLDNITIKNKRKKEVKPVPTREDPQDKLVEQFSREDKKDTW